MSDSTVEEPAWFCLKSLPKHEHIASAHLRQMAGVEVFCPRLRFKRPTSRGVVWVEEAMFPGYLFARFNYCERHKEVRYAMGVSGILQYGADYGRLDESIIDGLKSVTNHQHLAIVQSDIAEGESVKIVAGALLGLEAVVTQVLSGSERVRILVNFLGREMHAEVRKPAILPARRHPLAS
jgi:transcriptional antiterminator RfaH